MLDLIQFFSLLFVHHNTLVAYCDACCWYPNQLLFIWHAPNYILHYVCARRVYLSILLDPDFKFHWYVFGNHPKYIKIVRVKKNKI